MKKIKKYAFEKLVRSNSRIYDEYGKRFKRVKSKGLKDRLLHGIYIIELNLKYRIFNSNNNMKIKRDKKDEISVMLPKGIEKDNKKTKVSTSSKKNNIKGKASKDLKPIKKKVNENDIYKLGVVNRMSPQNLSRLLLNYETICIDFNILFNKKVDLQSDMIKLLSTKHNNINFYESRSKLEKFKGHVWDITDMYEAIEVDTNIDKEEGISLELETILDIYEVNDYIKCIYEILKYNNKNVIVIAETYYNRLLLDKLFEKSGFDIEKNLIITSEYGQGMNFKEKGLLKLIEKKYNLNLNKENEVILLSNNKEYIEEVRLRGWDGRLYKSCRSNKQIKNDNENDKLINSTFVSLINNHFNTGMKKYSDYYEIGFKHMGMFVYGYCNWINEKVSNNKEALTIFISENGIKLKETYDSIFNSENTALVYWSNLANTKLSSDIYKKEHCDNIINKFFEENSIVKDILDFIGYDEEEDKLRNYSLCKKDLVLKENWDNIRRFLLDNWEYVKEIHEKEKDSVKAYINNIIDKYNTIYIVDTSINGELGIGLEYFMRNVCKFTNNINILTVLEPSKNNMRYKIASINGLIKYFIELEEIIDRKHFIKAIKYLNSNLDFKFEGFRVDENNEMQLDFEVTLDENHDNFEQLWQGINAFCSRYYEFAKKYNCLNNISNKNCLIPLSNALNYIK